MLGHQYRWLAGDYDLEIGHFWKWLGWWTDGQLVNNGFYAQWWSISRDVSQQTKLYYRNIITILSFAVFNISSAYYGNVAQENTTFTNITLPNNII